MNIKIQNLRPIIAVWTLLTCLGSYSMAIETSPEQSLATLKQITPGDSSMDSAVAAAAVLQSSDLKPLTVLAACKEATPIGKNWLVGVATRLQSKSPASKDEMMQFLKNTALPTEARTTVFGWLTDDDDELRNELLTDMLEDPSLELRYAAIDSQLQLVDDSDSTDADKLTKYKKLVELARFPAQVISISKLIEDSHAAAEADKIVLRDFFGFIPDWKTIGPFPNPDQSAFNISVEAETVLINKGFQSDFTSEGMSGKTSWMELKASEKDGLVDLAEPYEKIKGAVIYGYAEFNSTADGDAELRLGSPNAHKIWLNGELVMSNEVYHASTAIDQYIEPIKLRTGTNKIVVKMLQNEQTQPWAQDYMFQLRITDATGKAIEQQ